MRAVRIQDWVEAIVPAFAHNPIDNGGFELVPPDPSRLRNIAREVQETRRAERRKITPEFLRQVAEAYRSDSVRPIVAIQDRFGGAFGEVKRRTALRWVSAAREGVDPETGQKYLAPIGEE